MLSAKNLTKMYGNSKVINDISLDIEQSEFVGIIGESGSGKSTLLYLLSGLIPPTSGTISIDKEEITGMNDKVLSKLRTNKVGFIFQFHNLVKGLTVLENMEIPLVLAKKNPQKYRERIHQLIESVGLSNYSEHPIEELSGGQQQRVAIARALVNNPSIIFADEPTGSLDSENTENVIQLLSKLNKEYRVTIVMVTHSDKTLVNCSRVIKICDGRKEEVG